jgi:hypothetical protein
MTLLMLILVLLLLLLLILIRARFREGSETCGKNEHRDEMFHVVLLDCDYETALHEPRQR